MPRRMLFPLRRCPGLVPLPEVDEDLVIVVVERPAECRQPTLSGYVDATALRAVLTDERRNFGSGST